MPDKGWHLAFDPIPVPDGRVLKTLHDAGHYATALPKAEQELPEWQAAAEMLILAAQGQRLVMFAEIAVRAVPDAARFRQEFENNFADMTVEPVELDHLLATRERMMHELQQGLTKDERRFLLLLIAVEPEWAVLGVPHLEQLPALRWKLQNLERLRKADALKFAEQKDTLTRLFR